MEDNFEKRQVYYAHTGENGKRELPAHCRAVAELAELICSIPLLKPLCYILGLIHDAGKFGDLFVNYLAAAEADPDSVRRGQVDHSTAGGVIVSQADDGSETKKLLSELLTLAAVSHHGVADAVTEGVSYIEKRKQKRTVSGIQADDIDIAVKRFYDEFGKDAITDTLENCEENLNMLLKNIDTAYGRFSEKKEFERNCLFALGMCERLLLSVLVDADRSDAARPDEPPAFPDKPAIFEAALIRLEKIIAGLDSGGKLSAVRAVISKKCAAAAGKGCGIYRLAVPAGGGKTLSSLRFAINECIKSNKERVFYIAPYNSILEQNADVIRKAVGGEIVLEHHCDVSFGDENEEDSEKRLRYEKLTENWDSPIVATTAVQFFNTFFSDKMRCVRRFHTLANSVILIDEVQALGLKLIGLFDLAVNFLANVAGSTVVLMTATQPPYEKLKEYPQLPALNMAETDAASLRLFDRVNFIDMTFHPDNTQREILLCELASLAGKIISDKNSLLIVVNTRACARNLFKKVKALVKDAEIYHLSTSMYPAHRSETLEKVKDALKCGRKVICVSTQLIEAGVDISFETAVRSMASLGSILQTAGRCNREGKAEKGNVYIVKICQSEERCESVKEIFKAQETVRELLSEIKKTKGKLNSAQTVEKYYYKFYNNPEILSELGYNFKNGIMRETIAGLLTFNTHAEEELRRKGKKPNSVFLKQAFKTAGENFEAIEDEKVSVIVRRDKAAELLDVFACAKECERKAIVRKLQRYTVGLSPGEVKTMELSHIDGLAPVLSENYYDGETGASAGYSGGLLEY